MSRSIKQIVSSMVARIPRGYALGKRGGIFDAQLHAPASEIVVVESLLSTMINEFDPRTATALLADFERCLGPDPCQKSDAELSISERQNIAHQRWTSNGGASIPYFISVALKLGIEIEIEEFWPSIAGSIGAGDELVPEGEQFVWLVKLAETTSWDFETGLHSGGDLLGDFIRSEIECRFQRIKPEQTHIVFSYGAL